LLPSKTDDAFLFLGGEAALDFLGREIKMGKRVALKGNAISYHVKNQNVIGV